MNDKNALGITGQERRFFHRGVAATDYDQVLVAKRGQRAVACRARRHAVAAETVRRFRFTRNSQPFRRSARRDDQRLSFHDFIVGVQFERTFAEIDFRDPFFEKLSAKALCLFAKLQHQVRALYAFGEAGIVLDFGRDHKLATGRGLLFSVCRSVDQ
jgi:hypothetical protein